jgi:hypothetical protein
MYFLIPDPFFLFMSFFFILNKNIFLLTTWFLKIEINIHKNLNILN